MVRITETAEEIFEGAKVREISSRAWLDFDILGGPVQRLRVSVTYIQAGEILSAVRRPLMDGRRETYPAEI